MLIYSPVRTGSADDLFERLKLDPHRRVLVAFTSSLDEIEANNRYLNAMHMEPFPERQPFQDQIEWLEALVAKVEASPDCSSSSSARTLAKASTGAILSSRRTWQR